MSDLHAVLLSLKSTVEKKMTFNNDGFQLEYYMQRRNTMHIFYPCKKVFVTCPAQVEI